MSETEAKVETASNEATNAEVTTEEQAGASMSEGTKPRSGSQTGGRLRSLSTSSTGTYNRCVVLAVDPSEYAKAAFAYFMENVFRKSDLLVLVHCPEYPNLPLFRFKSGLAPPVDEWKKVLDDMNAKTRKLEEDYEGECVAKKLKYKVRGESMKNAGEGICKIAEEEQADLIVIGSRGQSAIKRAFLGSVSDYVVRNSGIPTLIVPKGGKDRSGSKVSN